jgi:leucyl/phenylalanyl-tRNA--protein transferase
MAMDDGAIEWFSPDPTSDSAARQVSCPAHSRTSCQKGIFEIRINVSFLEVMQECAHRPATWINEEIIESYRQLHAVGHAHSVEAWKDGKLAGGPLWSHDWRRLLWESMFHHVRDASKVALLALVERLRKRRFTLLDTQWLTPHLQTFGRYRNPTDKVSSAPKQRRKPSAPIYRLNDLLNILQRIFRNGHPITFPMR